MLEYKRLFEPAMIGKMVVRNRFVFPATGTHYCEKDGTVSQQLINFLVRRARGGAGLIVVEYTEIDKEQQASTRALQIYDDRFIAGLSRLTDAVKAEGSAIAIQLHHAGRYSDHRISGRQAVAPSSVKSRLLRETPRELTENEIWDLIEKFVEGVRRAKRAGFDAVEFHAASGYLLNQFFSPLTNLRQDAWGGDTERRCRFMKEILTHAKQCVGLDYPLILRLAVDEYMEGGLRIDESTTIVRIMETTGIDAISVTAGGHDSTIHSSGQIVPGMFFPRGTYRNLSKAIKEEVEIPVMVAGRIDTPRLAESILENKQADFICMCRALIRDPDLPIKAKERRTKDIHRCLYDNTCADNIMRGVPGAALVCLMNPEVSREYILEPKAPSSRRVLILGGNPAGLEAARVARLRGHTVALFEKKSSLNDRWSWMIAPYVLHMRKILESSGVEIKLGKPIALQGVLDWRPDVVIATKAYKPCIPHIEGLGRINWAMAEDVFSGNKKPEGKIIILGGNNIGLEMAEFLTDKGNKITIVEEGWPGRGIARLMRAHYFERLAHRGVKLFPKTKIVRVQEGIAFLSNGENNDWSVEADWVVISLFGEIDDRPIEMLQGQSFEVVYINPIQSPRGWVEAITEGATVGRQL